MPSLFRDFSAPVKISYDYTPQQLATLIEHDSDAYVRWDAAQRMALNAIDGMLAKDPADRPQNLSEVIREIEEALDGTLRNATIEAVLARTLPTASGPEEEAAMREMAEILERWHTRDGAARAKGLVDLRLQQVRWRLEELRISLFAQEVKTAFPVSLKRLQKRWEELGL